MTCIVGIVHEGRVHMGADSVGSNWHLDRRVRADHKLFRNGEFILGCTTSYRMIQLLQFVLTPPPVIEGQKPFEHMVKAFVPAIRDVLKHGGFTKVDNNREEGGEFLVGFRGHLFHIHGDFQVGENVDGFDACGSGESFAMGAIAVTENLSPRDRLEAGLRAAERFNAGVGGPFHFLELEAKGPVT